MTAIVSTAQDSSYANTVARWSVYAVMLATLFLGGGAFVQAGTTVQTQIRDAINDFGRHELHVDSVTPGAIDPRLRLTPCRQQLNVFVPSGVRRSGQSSLGVKCQDTPGWKVFVPVYLRRYEQVVALKQPVVQGDIISAQDVMLVRKDMSRLHRGHYTDTRDVVGMETRRALRRDAVLTPDQLKPRRLVQRGDIITIVAQSSGLTIRTQGHALADGRRGEAIKVKNGKSKKILQAEVIGPGLVKVRM